MWYVKIDIIILVLIPLGIAIVLYYLKSYYHFKYLKLGYNKFQDYSNYFHYQLKIGKLEKDLYNRIAISFPIFTRDKLIENNNPLLKRLGKRITWLIISIWVILLYLFTIGFYPDRREIIINYLM